jgi:hypothetical protein
LVLVLFELVLVPIKPPVWFVSLLLGPVALGVEAVLFGLVLPGWFCALDVVPAAPKPGIGP